MSTDQIDSTNNAIERIQVIVSQNVDLSYALDVYRQDLQQDALELSAMLEYGNHIQLNKLNQTSAQANLLTLLLSKVK